MPFSLDPLPGENEIECARCGAYFFYDLTRCPECGVNIYEPDEGVDEENRKDTDDQTRSRRNLLSRVKNIFRRFSNKPYSAEEIFGDALDQAMLYNDLLRKVSGDHAVAERLITFEQQQKPGGTRKIWLENAIEQWEHDNRKQGSSS